MRRFIFEFSNIRLLRLQWKQDIDEAAKLMNKALEVDPKCEFAYETLGTIEIQRLEALLQYFLTHVLA